MQKENNQNIYYCYVRVSSKEQAEGESLNEQARQLKDYARRNNLQIKEPFYRETESAKSDDRKIFKEMVKDLRENKGKGLIFHKIDRSTRNFKDAIILEDLAKEGFEIHFVSDGISSKNENWRLFSIQVGFAKFYVDNLRHEIHKGINGMVEDGRCPTRAPIGYLDKGKGVKEPDPVMSGIVKRAFEIYSTGNYSIDALHKQLTKMGLMTKGTKTNPAKPLNPKALYKTLRNPFYYGVFKFKKALKRGSHQPIITKALFDQVQKVLDGRSYKHQRKFVYIFGGLMACPFCGKKLRSISARDRYKYYNCRFGCKCNIKEEFIEDQFFKSLCDIEFTEKETTVFLRAVAKFRADLSLNRLTQIKAVDLELSKIRLEKDKLLTLCLNGTIPEEEYKHASSNLVNKDKELCERRMSLEKADTETMNHIAKIGKLLKKPSLAYRMASDEKKRLLIRSLVENLSWQSSESDKTIAVIWKNEFRVIADRVKVNFGSATENRTPI